MDVRGLEGSDRDSSRRCGCGRDEHDRGKYDRDWHGRGEYDRDVNGGDEHDLCVDDRLHAGDLHENDLSGLFRHASAHARDARGQRRSCL